MLKALNFETFLEHFLYFFVANQFRINRPMAWSSAPVSCGGVLFPCQ
jgi:hypothetical protein